jgi:hypothetical protein
MISSFFDVFVDIDPALRPAFFDIFVGDDFRFRPSFFDVFCEIRKGSEGTFDTEMLQLSLVGGFLSPSSMELLMQMPMTGGGGGGGGAILLQRKGMTLAMAPVMLLDESSAMRHVLDSGHAIDSFFDVFTELSLAGGGAGQPGQGSLRRIGSFFDVFTELRRGRLILRKAGDAEMLALRARFRESPTRRSLAADVLRTLLDDLETQLMLDLKTRH